jgi:uncharacterized protein (TIRG00374 family)
LWWALHDVHLTDVLADLRGVRLVPFLLTLIIATAMFPLRTIRWRVLLRAEGTDLPFLPLWHATAIGFMANNVLPARAGEVARAYAARQLTGVRFSTAVASIAVERVLDGLTLVLVLVVAIWAGGFGTETTVGGVTLGSLAQGAGILFSIALAGAFAMVHWPEVTLRLVERTVGRVLPAGVAGKLVTVLEGLIQGLDALRSPRRFLQVGLWSLAVWGANGLSFAVCFVAFGFELPWAAAPMLMALIAFGVAVPSAPGFFGPFEIATRVALALYGIGASEAVSYAVGYHLGTFLPITVLGIWSLATTGIGFRDLSNARTSSESTDD